jgi:hypothetical protein
MDSRNLTKKQAEELAAKIQPMAGYLHRLRSRMIERGFPPDDPLLLIVTKAYDATDQLFMELHYRWCNGVG